MRGRAPGEEIALALAENFIVKVALRPDPADCPRLEIKDGAPSLRLEDGVMDVGIIPLPQFIRQQMQTRSPISENVCLDGYCLNVFLRAVGQGSRLNLKQDEVLDVIRNAFEEGVADLVQINMDYSKAPDRGFTRLLPVIQAIKKTFNTFVALRGFPPENRQLLDRLYAAGVDLLNLPLEGFAGGGNVEVPSYSQILDALEYAAGVFSPGALWTELALGGNPGPIKDKIDALAKKNIVPLLKLQAPSISTGNEYERVQDVVRHLDRAAQEARLPLKWLYPACRYVSPLDTAFFLSKPKNARLKLTPVYKSPLGRKASEGFAALRRRLRIKNVSDSYESAGL